MTTVTRDVILRTLRTRGKCTVKELAEAAGVSPVSVRHHLTNLQAEGLVAVEEVRHGVGRPHHLYFLTEEAIELFPTRYFKLTNRLLEEIKETWSEEQVRDLFSAIAASMADDYARALEGLTLPQKLERLSKMLADEGFDAEIELQGDRLLIRELSCPYFRIGQEHPEVCMLDQSFIATALSLPVERVTCLLEGDVHCTFEVNVQDVNSAQEISAHE